MAHYVPIPVALGIDNVRYDDSDLPLHIFLSAHRRHNARQLAHLGDRRPPRLPAQADIAEARSKLARQGLSVEPTEALASAGLSP